MKENHHKETEKALLRAKQEWERTFDSIPDMIAILDKEQNIVKVNKAMAERLKMIPGQCAGLKCYDCFHKSQGPPAYCPHIRTMSDGRTHTSEIYEETLGGNFLITTTPLYDEQNKIIGSVHVARDITLRKKAEEALLRSERRLSKAEEIGKLGSWELDVIKNKLSWSDEIYRIFGMEPRKFSVTYEAFLNCVHPEDREKVDKAYSNSISEGRDSYEIQHRIVRKDNGEVRHVLEKCEHIKNTQGKIIRSVGMVQDITDYKETEEKLKKYAKNLASEKAKDEALLSSMGQGVVATDIDGKIVFANGQAKLFFNRKYSSLKGRDIRNVLELYDSRERLIKTDQRPFLSALKRKKNVSRNFFCRNYKNEKRYLSITAAPIFLNKKITGTVSIYRDITKEKEVEKAKTEFVSLASHQLRTPITEIGLSAEMLLTGMAGPVQKGQKMYLKNIEAGVKEITSLVDTLLNISRIEMGTFIISPKRLNVPKLTEELINNFSLQLNKKGLALKKSFDKIQDMDVDPHIYQMIFDNIFSNALKYTEKGSVSVELYKKGRNMVLKISDTGCGIPENQQHLVFGKLFRADNPLKSKTKGYGLGLYIIKSIIEKIGGEIKFESKEGSGTTFYIFLPLSGMKREAQPSLL